VKTLYEQKANKCRHFNGLMNAACDAGVSYASVKQTRTGGHGFNFPCFKDRMEGCACEKQSFQTDAEINAEIEESDRRFQNTMTARMAIVEHLGGTWKRGSPGVSGSIACPVCKAGTLRFSRAAVNGHIHARCSTADCVAWME
jgi:hypothetical protein